VLLLGWQRWGISASIGEVVDVGRMRWFRRYPLLLFRLVLVLVSVMFSSSHEYKFIIKKKKVRECLVAIVESSHIGQRGTQLLVLNVHCACALCLLDASQYKAYQGTTCMGASSASLSPQDLTSLLLPLAIQFMGRSLEIETQLKEHNRSSHILLV
jgi:hypothetical protein